jgi:glutamine amidotransferase
MCRFVAYTGEDILLNEVLVKPENSLVLQSLHAREASEVPTNGDGFGIGWYMPSISRNPGIFTSIFPAWNDQNLLHITYKIKSPCFFGHVRAASVGGINAYNCHPFFYERWMLMHNGNIGDFILIKRHIRRMLDDEYYQWIQGETDSEHLFALFLQLIRNKKIKDITEVAETLLQTLSIIRELICMYGAGGTSYYNLCLTDGERMIATRYCSDKKFKPSSLHYVICHDDEQSSSPKKHAHQKPKYVLISSERLTDLKQDWKTVPVNHMLLVDEVRKVDFVPMEIG